MNNIKTYILEKLHINKNFKSNQEFENWDEFKEYLESIDIKVIKNSRFWWWLESKEKSIKCLVSPTGDDFFFINSRADTNEGIIYINEYGKWVALSANNYKFDLTVDEEDKPAFKYSSNTANILKKLLSGDFNVTEKLHIGKDSNFAEYFTVVKIAKMMQKILMEEYKIEVGDISIRLSGSNCLKLELSNYRYYYDKGTVPDAKKLLSELIRKYESAGILFDEKPTLDRNTVFTFKIRNMI